ncbi:MAG TPA: hypothetical protein VN110_02005 [Sphingobium sp.]|nr:hypothetical protein [Sphingobium sp.]
MKQDPSLHAVFTWSRCFWTVAMAGVGFAIYACTQYRLLSEEQLILLVFLAVPVAAFFISGTGQDRSEIEPQAPRKTPQRPDSHNKSK